MTEELTQRQVTSTVANRIDEMAHEGFVVAPNYSVSNALSSAYNALKNSANGNLLAKCTSDSIYNALLDMVTQGLSPAKTQCYFIPYGQEVKLMRSYFGTMKVVKQLSEVKDIWAEVIYEGDEVDVEVVDGQRVITNHKTDWKNQDNNIEGAYCIIEDNEGKKYTTIMTKKEIDMSWSKSRNKKVQNEFPQEMAKRTVINRAAKRFFNSSNDDSLFVDAVNRTTQNEFEVENNQPKDVTPTEESLDDFLNGADKAVVIVDSEADDQEMTSTSEAPVSESESELQSEAPSEKTTLFDQLGELYD